MSALVRYFLSKGKAVGGYDRTPSELTEKLKEEGAWIHYEDNVSLIPSLFLDAQTTLVVYTPAIPSDHSELAYFRGHGFEIQKRAQVLGMLTQTERGLCVAGTRDTREDHDFDHGGLSAGPFARGMQRIFRRYIEEL